MGKIEEENNKNEEDFKEFYGTTGFKRHKSKEVEDSLLPLTFLSRKSPEKKSMTRRSLRKRRRRGDYGKTWNSYFDNRKIEL